MEDIKHAIGEDDASPLQTLSFHLRYHRSQHVLCSTRDRCTKRTNMLTHADPLQQFLVLYHRSPAFRHSNTSSINTDLCRLFHTASSGKGQSHGRSKRVTRPNIIGLC